MFCPTIVVTMKTILGFVCIWEGGVSKKEYIWLSALFIYVRIHILKDQHTKGLEMHLKWETPVNGLFSWQNGNFKLHRQLIVACLWNDRSIIFSFVFIESQSPWHSVLHYPPATNHMMIFKEWRALSIMGWWNTLSFIWIKLSWEKKKSRCLLLLVSNNDTETTLNPENQLLCSCIITTISYSWYYC